MYKMIDFIQYKIMKKNIFMNIFKNIPSNKNYDFEIYLVTYF